MISYLRPGTCLVVSSVVLFRCDVERKSPNHRIIVSVRTQSSPCYDLFRPTLKNVSSQFDWRTQRQRLTPVRAHCVLYMMALGRINNGRNFCVLNFRSGGNCCDVAITLRGWFLCETLLIAPSSECYSIYDCSLVRGLRRLSAVTSLASPAFY